jgi:pyruvate,water dikinase
VNAVRLKGSGVPTSVAGGKGSALDRLIAVDAPVPATGVVTTDAYRAFVDASDLGDRLDILADAGTPSPDRFADHAADVDAAFLDAPMPEAVERAIVDLAAEIRGNGNRLAVRSSATAEDTDTASFAGQYRSFLELVDDEEVLRAVRLVWSSLWHAAPMAYREHRGISHDAQMAVVVMRLVEPKTAGVVFTIDPGGAPDHMRIEFVHGLAEGLVSGTETPEAVVMERSAVPPSSDAPLAELVPLTLQIEEAFGAPQDIEWAHDGTTLYLVQARPITTSAHRAPDDDGFDTVPVEECAYTPAGIGEMLPGVLPPLLWSIDGPLIEEGFRHLFGQLGVVPDLDESGAVVGRFRGRAALNLDLLKAAAGAMPGGTAAEMERQYFGEVVSPDLAEEEPTSGGKLSRMKEIPASVRALSMRRHLASEANVIIAAVERIMERRLDPASLNDAHLLAYWRRIRVLAERVVATQVAVAASAAAAYRGLEMFLEPHCGDESAFLTQQLTAGGIEACGLRTSLDVCDLVQTGLGDDDVREALDSIEDPERMRQLLEGTESGRAFLTAFRARLDHAGSAAVFGGPTWGEDEAAAWNVLRQAVLVETETGRPVATTDRADVLDEVIGRLTSQTKWKVTRVMTGQVVDMRIRMLRQLVSEAVNFLALRESTKVAVLRLGGEARRATKEIAERLTASGTLADVESAELLSIDELEMAFAGADVDRSVLHRRRRALDTAQAVGPLPRIFKGRPERVEVVAPGPGESIDGWAASPGLYRGTARVVTNVADARLEPGDILVAPATDPSWTPLFLTAGALIVEEGGPLSHAAIVARELGLPAVLNVAGATGLIIDGEEVTVDGSTGRILLHRSETEQEVAA